MLLPLLLLDNWTVTTTRTSGTVDDTEPSTRVDFFYNQLAVPATLSAWNNDLIYFNGNFHPPFPIVILNP